MEERLYESFSVINDIYTEFDSGKISSVEAYAQLVAEVEVLQSDIEDSEGYDE